MIKPKPKFKRGDLVFISADYMCWCRGLGIVQSVSDYSFNDSSVCEVYWTTHGERDYDIPDTYLRHAATEGPDPQFERRERQRVSFRGGSYYKSV